MTESILRFGRDPGRITGVQQLYHRRREKQQVTGNSPAMYQFWYWSETYMDMRESISALYRSFASWTSSSTMACDREKILRLKPEDDGHADQASRLQ